MDEKEVPQLLIDFLDAESMGEKLKILEDYDGEIDERTMGNIEASLDIVGKDASVEERLEHVKYYLEKRKKFETGRLR